MTNAATPRGYRPSVLIVDDEKVLLAAYDRILRTQSTWDVVLAHGGLEATDLLHRQQFDVVLSDYQMPDVRGDIVLETAARLQPRARRLMVTASAVNADKVHAHRVLAKPCDVSLLLEMLSAAVEMPSEEFIRRAPAA